MAEELTWSGSLHQTFRLLPRDNQSANLRPFLQADGLTPEELLERLPYDRARAKDQTKTAPDPKRYRDGRQVYQTVGLLYEDGGGQEPDLDALFKLEVSRILGRELELPVEVEHVCGTCGESFVISDSDPHWSTGRGPICPMDRKS